jgi:hypothetical protein
MNGFSSHKPTKGGLIAFSVFFALASLGFLGAAIYSKILNFQFASEKVVHESGVVDSITEYQHHGISYIVKLHFPTRNGVFYADRYTSQQDGEGLQVGGTVPVKYFEDNPEQMRIDLPGADRHYADFVSFFLYIFAFFGVLSIYWGALTQFPSVYRANTSVARN